MTEKKLLDLVTNQTLNLFEALNIYIIFLWTDPNTWDINK